jgi:hypothetical protein
MPKQMCLYCGEEVFPGEGSSRVVTSLKDEMHAECLFRSVAGSVAHIQKRCSCYVKGSSESDDPGLTLRQGAKASLEEWRKVHGET